MTDAAKTRDGKAQDGKAQDGFAFSTIADYGVAYRDGSLTPLAVTERWFSALAKIESRQPAMNVFIAQSPEDLQRQASASAERFAQGKPLGPLDGVPIAVKDEVDQKGYPTTVGTSFYGAAPAMEDSTAVARLRAAGALLVGKVNMHEVGLGVTGINPHHGTPRNPYDPGRVTGGSSSGSATVVSCGLCPGALGADGGGSIRIPSSLCGVAGIKPTFGRVSEIGAAPICWSVAHIGPIAAAVADVVTMLEVMAGPDPSDPNTLGQPKLDLTGVDNGATGLRIGWCPQWADVADNQVREICKKALEGLQGQGAEVVEVQIDHLEDIPLVQYVTIGVEMASSQHETRQEHKKDYGPDVRLLLEGASQIPGVDYVRAQRLRTLINAAFCRTLDRVDLIASPSTACTAPVLKPDSLAAGESDDERLAALTAFAFAPNLTGMPAASLPVGYDSQGLPVGLQLIGRTWDEATVLRAALALEQGATRQKPRVFVRVLP